MELYNCHFEIEINRKFKLKDALVPVVEKYIY